MIELLYVLAGCIIGIFTGIAPGIHINTVSAVLLVFAASGDFNLVLLIVAMSVMHAFVDFVTGILLGAPDENSFLSVLPGHRLLLKGLGYKAIKLTSLGCFFGAIFALLLAPLFLVFIAKFIPLITIAIPYLLGFVLILMVYSEKNIGKKLWALAVIALSGIMGLYVLRNLSMGNALFPLITGFFGISNLLFSLKNNSFLPKQRIEFSNYSKKMVLHGSFLSAIAGGLVALLPSIGPNEAAFMLRKLLGKISTSKYLVMLWGISTSNMIFSFFVLFALGKTRTESAAAIAQIINLQAEHMVIIALVCVFVAGIAFLVTDILAKALVNGMQSLNYKALNGLVLAVLLVLVFLLSGPFGLFVCAIATAVGLIPIATGTKRTNAMAFLMLPTMLFYLGL